MEFKVSLLASAAAVAVSFSGFAAGSASAATLGSIGFAGTWSSGVEASPAPVSPTLSFGNLATLVANGLFSGYTATSIKDLALALASSSVVGTSTVSSYGIATGYDGTAWKTYTDGLGNVITFDLALDATWLRTFDNNDGDINYEQSENGAGVFEYTGTYNFSDGSTLFGRGQLNASLAGTAQIFEVSQTVVPLPAAVWGLVTALALLGGFGARRKQAAA